MTVTTSKNFAPVHTWLPPWDLSTCIRAVLVRNTTGLNLAEADRWAYYPATPACSINFLWSGVADVLTPGSERDVHVPRQRVAALSVSGPQTQPRSVFYEAHAHGAMVMFYPDAWHVLTGVSPDSLRDQIVEARTVLPVDVLQAFVCMDDDGTDAQRVQRFFDALSPVWQQCKDRGWHAPWDSRDWSKSLSPWMASLALRAAATRWGRSLRQSERRIKQWTGGSLRRLKGSVRGEAVFFSAMAALMDGRVDWAQIALDHGFTDQSHLIREVRRLTGFTPEALRHGILNEEAFWSYRAWAHLAGYTLLAPFPFS